MKQAATMWRRIRVNLTIDAYNILKDNGCIHSGVAKSVTDAVRRTALATMPVVKRNRSKILQVVSYHCISVKLESRDLDLLSRVATERECSRSELIDGAIVHFYLFGRRGYV